MKNLYREFYTPSKEEFDKIWREGIFIFDSCVFLNLYEYSEQTSNDLLKIIEHLKDRIWLPHQVGLEFFKERLSVIHRQKNAYSQLITALDGATEVFKKTFNKANLQQTHRYFDKELILNKVTSKITSLKRNINKLKEKHPNWTNKDEILDKITLLFDGNKHGAPFKKEDYEKICKEADRRYSEDCPPGYMDAKKDNDDKTNKKKYGDYLIWRQIIDFAKKVKKPILFITEDIKEDWWKLKDKTTKTILAPRDELIKEIFEEANVNFYIYQTNQFIKNATKLFNITIADKTIKEVKNIPSDIKEILTGEPAVVGTAMVNTDYVAQTSINDIGIIAGNSPEKNVGKTPKKRNKIT